MPTLVDVSLQRRIPGLAGDLAWEDAPAGTATLIQLPLPPGLLRWSGSIDFAALPQPGEYRVLIREYEYLSANYTINSGRGRTARRDQPKRLIYAETVLIDQALIGGPGGTTGTTL